MPSVPWSTLAGEVVETVVSNLLYNEHPRAIRVRPSQGDYGIDLMVPRPLDGGEIWDIYQVKKFAVNLTDSQKTQIEKSFRRIMYALVRKGIPVGDWYLVLPLDPTTENLQWFGAMPGRVIDDMFAEQRRRLRQSAEEKDSPLTASDRDVIDAWRTAPGRTIAWKGLTACDAWASKYWFVIDYHLFGGSERLRSAVADVAKIIYHDQQVGVDDGDQTSILTPAQMREHLARLQGALDGDAHFRYGVSLDPHTPPICAEPGLVAAEQHVAADGSCITFRIYKRFDEALNERQIPLNLRFAFDDPDFDHAAYGRWRKYGTPLAAPASVEVDLPGGLGQFDGPALVEILPQDGRQHSMRMRVRASDGTACDPLAFEMTSTQGPDGTGVWARGTDASGLVVTEGFLDKTGPVYKSTFEIKLKRPVDREIGEVWPALAFMASLVHPNVLQIAPKYGPFRDMQQVPDESPSLPPSVVEYLQALATIQGHCDTAIRIPDWGEVTVGDRNKVLRTAALLEGQVVVSHWEYCELGPPVTEGLDLAGVYEVEFISDHSISVGNQVVPIAPAVRQRLLSVRLEDLGDGRVRLIPHLNDTAHWSITDCPRPPEGQLQVLVMKVPGGDE
ncbi:hypothetical protein [Nocardia cyriacigeorgica]|uniref:hypothetical protein n=1 Tax=Nocardia cyriacigeorgica TaxID=135487 RepID=UPI00131A07AA|nr:hypothetical protein [Nocardia cyriacigeorgica]